MSEALASKLLKSELFTVLSRNRRFGGVEIDIVAKTRQGKEEYYWFFEVKKRKRSQYNSGYPAMSKTQAQRYQIAIDCFIQSCERVPNVNAGLIVIDENDLVIDMIYPVRLAR